MSATQSTPLRTPEEIAMRAGQQTPFVRLAQRSLLYAEREMRLRQLAASHAMRDYLLLLADIAHAQHALLKAYPAVSLPDSDDMKAAARTGQPPLPAALWSRDPVWRAGLRKILDDVQTRLPDGSPAKATVEAIKALNEDAVEQQAGRLLNGITLGLDVAAAPFIAAALQAYWAHMVLAIHEANGVDQTPPFARTLDATKCPCCGSHPTASVLRVGSDVSGHRYLHCSLCAAEWHMVRIKCTHCESTKGINYHVLAPLEDTSGSERKSVVQAETCDECGHYLKIVHMERDPQVDPVADDLASISLDMLVAETGKVRHGVNLLLLFGEDAAPPDGS